MLGNLEIGSTETSEPHIFGQTPTTVRPIVPLPVRPLPAQRFLSAGEYRLLPLTVDAKALFDSHVSACDFLVADLSFSNNFMWLSRMSGFYQIIDDCFCLFSLNGNQLGMLLPPIGAAGNQARALRTCIEIMDSYNHHAGDSRVDYVSPEFARLLELDGDGRSPHLDDGAWLLEPAFPDYIYRTADLIELRGNSYKTKRSEINQFCRAHPNHRIEPLHRRHWDGMRELLSQWMRARLEGLHGTAVADFIASVELERQGIERALAHYDALGLSGLCLIVDNRIEGFTFGERISRNMASVLVEKTNFAIPGAAQYLFREYARTYADCDYINVGDDLGLENLRRVKMSYRPVLFGEKFTLKRSEQM
jgi:hypothetical protein